MTNEQNKKPNVAESVARSVTRLEERINITEGTIKIWLNQLEGAVKSFTQSVIDRFIAADEADEDEEDE